MFGNKIPTLRVLTHKSGLVGEAIRIGEKRKMVYVKARSGASNFKGSQTKQADPQADHIFAPLTEKQMMDVQRWFLLQKSCKTTPQKHRQYKYPPFALARFRFIFLWSHNAISRGDDFRSELISLGHMNIMKHSKNTGPDIGYIMVLLKDSSKRNIKGLTELTGLTRHKNPFLCGINSVGAYLICRFGRNGVADFPDIFNPNNNLTATTYLTVADDGKSVFYYCKERIPNEKKHFYRVEGKRKLSQNQHHEGFEDMKKSCNLEFIPTTTHF